MGSSVLAGGGPRPHLEKDQSPPVDAVSFGQTRVIPARRQLSHKGVNVDISDRAFDLLIALIDARGSLLSKDQLMERVWPGRIVGENTLEGQISILRRALGDDRNAIHTITGRGYQFTGELSEACEPTTVVAIAPTMRQPGVPLPASISKLIGRESDLHHVSNLLLSHRLVTLIGSGGVGKTRLAIEAARLVAPHFPDGVYLAELAATTSTDYLPTTLALALGLPADEVSLSLERWAVHLRERQLLLLLDNCEHLIESAARLAESFLRIAPLATIVATSREPLRVAGERLYRVASLEVPADDHSADANQFGAIQLLEERIGFDGNHDLDRASALALKARICRRLDGIPLAIELAAACVPALGLHGVAERLDDRFQFLTRGARGALPRQQTLRATLDWSYDLLSELERSVLNRLSVFASAFTLDSAQAVVSCEHIPADAVATAIVDLVSTSLVSVIAGAGRVRYRLLETTRVYAHDKLEASGKLHEILERHARHCLTLLQDCERQAVSGARIDRDALYAPYLDDLRSALTWGFSAQGDAQIAVDLTIASAALSMQFALQEECLSHVDTALTRLGTHAPSTREHAMRLHAARGACLLYQNAGSKTDEAFCTSLDLAEQIGDVEYQLRGLWGRWSHAHLTQRYAETLSFAQRFSEIAVNSAQACDQLVAYRLSGVAHLCLGGLRDAQADFERVVSAHHHVPRARRIRFLYDESTLANAGLAHALWLMGRPDQAMCAAQRSFRDAKELGHASSRCYALSVAVCPIALLTGDDTALDVAVSELMQSTRQHGTSTWKARGQMWQAFLELRAGDIAAFETTILPVLNTNGAARFSVALTPFLSATAFQLATHGEAKRAHALIDPEIARALKTGDECSLVELMRVKAEMLMLDGTSRLESAGQAMLEEALLRAGNRGFLAWELRCATNLAAFWASRDRADLARDLLAPVYQQFSEGLNTADLRAARVLLGR